ATSRRPPRSWSRRAPRSPTATCPAARTCASWRLPTNRCESCCASPSARTTSSCAKRSAPRSRRPPNSRDTVCLSPAGGGRLRSRQRLKRHLRLLQAGEQRVDVVLEGDLVANVALGERSPCLSRRHDLYLRIVHVRASFAEISNVHAMPRS